MLPAVLPPQSARATRRSRCRRTEQRRSSKARRGKSQSQKHSPSQRKLAGERCLLRAKEARQRRRGAVGTYPPGAARPPLRPPTERPIHSAASPIMRRTRRRDDREASGSTNRIECGGSRPPALLSGSTSGCVRRAAYAQTLDFARVSVEHLELNSRRMRDYLAARWYAAG